MMTAAMGSLTMRAMVGLLTGLEMTMAEVTMAGVAIAGPAWAYGPIL